MFDLEEGSKQSENLVDRFATATTKSLFAYLNNIRAMHVLFGHQLTMHEGFMVLGQ